MKRQLLRLTGAAASMTLVAGLAFSGAASAALIDRGGGLIYDTMQDITWLQDANYAFTSGFAAANVVDNGISATDNIFADGRMGWDAAVAWADGLSFVDTVRGVTWDDWRLPLTPQPDPSCSIQSSLAFPDQGSGVGCTGSEMGHLFNVDGISLLSSGLFIFTGFTEFGHWSGSEFAPIPSLAWDFDFVNGFQDVSFKSFALFAWAVRPGDVVAQRVPEPGTVVLIGAALGLLGWRGPARRRRSVIRSFG